PTACDKIKGTSSSESFIMTTETRETQPTSWKSVLYGTLTVLLLVPVPVFAYTLSGSWSVSQTSGLAWGASGTGDVLTITPAQGGVSGSDVVIDFTIAVTATGGSANISATSFDAINNINTFNSGRLTVTIGFEDKDHNLINSTKIVND